MAKLVHNVQKKQHRERAQVSSRARFGLLEKKKDYKLRAEDYHKKQNALKALKMKAEQYNPDEYYHAMVNRKTDESGILQAQGEGVEFNNDQMKLFKTQDINYVRTMRLQELAKIEKEKKDLAFKAGGKHTVFVDSVEEQQKLTPETFFKTDSRLLDRRENRLRVDQLQSNRRLFETENDPEQIDAQNKEKLQRLKTLQQRLKREKELGQVETQLALLTELMKKGGSRKLVDKNGKVYYKWQNTRKR